MAIKKIKNDDQKYSKWQIKIIKNLKKFKMTIKNV